MKRKFRLGTRGSPLALAQVQLVSNSLALLHPDLEIIVVPIVTTGDRYQKGRLADIGGKGLFIKELEEALRENLIDAAVHSMKDVETWLHPDFLFPAFLPRASPYDVLISKNHLSLKELPASTIIGTASLRRSSFIRFHYPHLNTQVLRGNIQTRLQKLDAGIIDAIILAEAGLSRLNYDHLITERLTHDFMVPSAGQGIIGIQCLTMKEEWLKILAPLNDLITAQAFHLERAFLEEVDGTCGTPVGAYAQINNEVVEFMGAAADPNGQDYWRQTLTLPLNQSEVSIRKLEKKCVLGFVNDILHELYLDSKTPPASTKNVTFITSSKH